MIHCINYPIFHSNGWIWNEKVMVSYLSEVWSCFSNAFNVLSISFNNILGVVFDLTGESGTGIFLNGVLVRISISVSLPDPLETICFILVIHWRTLSSSCSLSTSSLKYTNIFTIWAGFWTHGYWIVMVMLISEVRWERGGYRCHMVSTRPVKSIELCLYNAEHQTRNS